jgi:hypothetical protein
MRLIYALILFLLSSGIGLADGGAVQLHVAAPPFVVTVFTDPPVCRAGQVDLSAFIQEEKGPVLDAEVVASLSALEPAKTVSAGAWLPPACAANATTDLQNVPLQIARGTNRLFYSTLIQIPYGGRCPRNSGCRSAFTSRSRLLGMVYSAISRNRWFHFAATHSKATQRLNVLRNADCELRISGVILRSGHLLQISPRVLELLVMAPRSQ